MGFGAQRPNWSVEGRDWPNREHSRFVSAGGMSWHVQEMGEGPRLLLLHGTGAATHSFRDLAPKLAKHFHLACAGPARARLHGHAAQQRPVAARHGAACRQPARQDGVRARHRRRSFGGRRDPDRDGAVGSRSARRSSSPSTVRCCRFAARRCFRRWRSCSSSIRWPRRLFAWRALSHDATRRLLEGTGSAIDAARHRTLPAPVPQTRPCRRHARHDGELGPATDCSAGLLALSVPLVLVSAANDKAVPPRDAATIAARVPVARAMPLGDGGHLVHEEQPARLAELVVDRGRVKRAFRRGSKLSVCKIRLTEILSLNVDGSESQSRRRASSTRTGRTPS